MDQHSGYKGSEDFIAHKILDTIIEHTLFTVFQVFMFMSDKSMDALCERIIEQKNKIQGCRMKDEPEIEKEA